MNKTVENILSIFKGRNVRIFLVFVLVSTLIWFIEKLRQNYTLIVDVPIECINIPEGFVVSDKPQKIKIMISADGSNLFLHLMRNELITVPVDVTAIRRKVNKNGQYRAIFLPKMISTYLQENLPDHIELKSILTDSIYIDLLTVEKKILPIKLKSEPPIAQQHIISRKTKISPPEITVIGTNDILDTMTYVYVENSQLEAIDDTVTFRINIDLPTGVKADKNVIDVTYFVEPFTEKQLEVPITGLNVPEGYHFRAFPATVRMTCNVGLSRFDDFSAQDIDICADLSSVVIGNEDKEKLKLTLRNYPDYIQNVSYSPIFVEYLLEKE